MENKNLVYERKQKEYRQSGFWLFQEFVGLFVFQHKVKQHRIPDFYLFRLLATCCHLPNGRLEFLNSNELTTTSYILIELGTLPHSSSQHRPIPYSFPPSIWLRFFKSSVLSNWDIFKIMNIHSFRYRLNIWL